MSFSWLGVCLASVYLRLFLEFPQSWFRQFLHVLFDVYVGKWEVEAIWFTILLELYNFRYGNWWLLSQSNFKFSGLPWWKFISGLPNSPLCVFVISISGGVVAVVVLDGEWEWVCVWGRLLFHVVLYNRADFKPVPSLTCCFWGCPGEP